MRIVIDTNVLVSGIAYPYGFSGKIVSMWRSGSLKVTLSSYLLDEFKRGLPRLSRNTLSATEIDRLVDTFLFIADVIEPDKVPHTVRDSKDDPVLALLVESGAEALITGDKDLLALAERYPVLTPAEFWERYGNVTG
jgi:putative PIN family toxin of toxin-antitoxin system